MRVSVVIPTHNEAQSIGRVLADLPADTVTEVLVVDSNSNDGTPEIASKMGARIIREPRRGYGRACLTGLAEASDADIVVFLDGDYSDRPAELPLLLAPILEGRADITLGSRLQKSRSADALPWHQMFGNSLAASMIRILYRLDISDLGPFRAGRADVLRALALQEVTYGWAVEMILKGTLAGVRVVEVPVSYHPRIGKSKISGTLRGTVGAAWFILSLIARYYFRYRRAKNPPPAALASRSAIESCGVNTAYSPNGGRTLVVMAKAPRPGMVKTRLSPSLPVEAVTELYRCLLNDTIALAHSLKMVEVAIMCPASDVEELIQLAPSVSGVVGQEGQGLAAGLTSAFGYFASAGYQRVVAFNSDSPHLPASILEHAFETLTSHDVVVGPTHDGGYYLVGAKASHAGLFDGDSMGTNSALEALLARARSLQLSVGFTHPFYDIDVAGDLTRLASELEAAPNRAPRTAIWFKEWALTVAQLRTGTAGL